MYAREYKLEVGTIYIVSIESIFSIFVCYAFFHSLSASPCFCSIFFISFHSKRTQSHKSNYHKIKLICCCCCSKCLPLPFEFSAPLLFAIKNYENVSAFCVILYLAFHLLLFLRYFVISSSITPELRFSISLCQFDCRILFSFFFLISVCVFGCCRFYPLLFYYKFRRYIKEWHSSAFSMCIFLYIFACYEVNLYYSENRLDKFYPKLVNYVNFILFAIHTNARARFLFLSFLYLSVSLCSTFNSKNNEKNEMTASATTKRKKI